LIFKTKVVRAFGRELVPALGLPSPCPDDPRSNAGGLTILDWSLRKVTSKSFTPVLQVTGGFGRVNNPVIENKPVNETSTVVALDHAWALFNVTQTSRIWDFATKF